MVDNSVAVQFFAKIAHDVVFVVVWIWFRQK